MHISTAADGMRVWTIPNILTMGRLLAAPGVALVFVLLDRPLADWLALILFIGAAVTDFFDGWLARRLDQVSELGKMLDPIADKVMVIIALMVLVHIHRAAELLILPAVLIALREVVISGIREYLGEVKLPVTTLAKWKTTVQMVAIGCLLAVAPAHALEGAGTPWAGLSDLLDNAGLVLIWIAAVLTLLSGFGYVQAALEHLRARRAP